MFLFANKQLLQRQDTDLRRVTGIRWGWKVSGRVL